MKTEEYFSADGVQVRREISRRIAENEIFLAFTDDEGAEAFDDWWRNEGRVAFAKWLKSNDLYESQHRFLDV